MRQGKTILLCFEIQMIDNTFKFVTPLKLNKENHIPMMKVSNNGVFNLRNVTILPQE